MPAHLEHDDELSEISEINVIPFIDIVLVLLIIFMVAAPLATVDIKVDLPASTAEAAPEPDQPVYLTIKSDRSYFVGEEPVTPNQLAAALKQAAHGNENTRIFLRADKTVDYGVVMHALNTLRSAGYLKVALVGLERRN